MEQIITTNGLTKVYGKKTAVKDVSMHVPTGCIYGLIGRNGAGKTTIMRMLSGLSEPTRGSYALFGKTGIEMRKLRRQVGVLIESPGILPNLSAFDNVKAKCIALGAFTPSYAAGILDTVGLADAGRKLPARNFSMGMRQRLGLALALVGDPKLLILDEPINGLDPQGILEIRSILVRLRDERGMTVMISSHILDELAKVADFFGIINDGDLIDEFSAEELHRRSGRCVVIRAGEPNAVRPVLESLGIHDVSVEPDGSLRVNEQMERTADMAAAIVGAGLPLSEIFLRTASLEEYYLSRTGGVRNV